jgi:cytidine deaminase
VLVDISQTRDEACVQLAPGVLDGKFRLSPEEVQGLLQEYGVSEDELLKLLITPASRLARPPISSYRVG